MPDENTRKHLVFVSYNRKDLKVVQVIGKRLQSCGLDLWLDTQALHPGMEWMTELEDAISRSQAAVIFKGPHGIGSFQREEVSVLFKLHADRQLLLIPVLLPGASGKNAGLLLGNIQHVDFRLRAPDPLSHLLSSLTRYVPTKTQVLQPSNALHTAHPLVQWIVDEMDNLKGIERYGRLYIEARRWPEALYIYYRLANLAISRSNRAYADSYLQIGWIYFLAGERDKAEKKWEISLRIYNDYFQTEVPLLRRKLSEIRAKPVGQSPAG
jgi:tetratricopeptide (TPR) repeat protein